VSVRGVKRFLVDQETKLQVPEVRAYEFTAKRKVAIVGAGPAGLSCAYFLARMGYKPTVFESEAKPGGMLVQTIPAYRLPRNVLNREIKMIEQLGARMKNGKRLGRDFTLASLKDDGWEAVFVGVGAQAPVTLGIPGENTKGVVDALEFLREYNLHGKTVVGTNVAVVGGGNAAIDAARTALRLGAKTVTVLYRRTREEMPAWTEEIEEAEKEGMVLRELVAPVEVVAKGGRVTGLVVRPMKLGEYDRSGRRRPEGEAGKESTMAVDQIIAAIGQRVSTAEIFDGVTLDLSDQKTLAVNALSGQTSVPWVFAGGDVVSGPSSVVEAVGAGERAAAGIDEFLTGESHAFWRAEQEVETSFDPDVDPVSSAREEAPLIAVGKRKASFAEVEGAWNETVAIRQAKRCLRCDYGKKLSTGKEKK
jgi:NADH-quinone oxidoreductase subunit F